MSVKCKCVRLQDVFKFNSILNMANYSHMRNYIYVMLTFF